ncbi:Dolichol-phosphate mannose synthase subunit 2, partial [Mucuna pruriens]
MRVCLLPCSIFFFPESLAFFFRPLFCVLFFSGDYHRRLFVFSNAIPRKPSSTSSGVFLSSPVLFSGELILFQRIAVILLSSTIPVQESAVLLCYLGFTIMEVRTISSIEMELADRAVGFLLSFISVSIFTYYTFWVIILPFVDDDHFVHKYFLPQEYAILIPVSAGVALVCFLSIFIGFVMLKSKKKKA